jgi:hypothetical protein
MKVSTRFSFQQANILPTFFLFPARDQEICKSLYEGLGAHRGPFAEVNIRMVGQRTTLHPER